MQNRTSYPFLTERWFYFFIILHLIGWTCVPAFVRLNLPLDSIEGTIWGHQLEWGYDKNPFLNGWLTALAGYLGGPSGWMIYLFSQLSVIACFWSVWQLAKRMLTPMQALASVLLLETMQYFNFHAIDFNDNTLELGLWALAIYSFYDAVKQPNKINWLLTGIFSALGVMAKYYTLALLAPMFAFLILDKHNRNQLKTCAPYLGLLIFLIIILPHTIWLFFHNFVTIHYVFQRTHSEPSLLNHIFFPLQFAWQQLEVFLPAVLVYLCLFIGRKPLHEKAITNSFDKKFLLYVGLGPFLLTVLLSIVSGIKLRAGWGMPLLSFWGILLFAFITPRLSAKKLYSLIAFTFIFLAVLLFGYRHSIIDSNDTSSANFPGKIVAETIAQQWYESYHTKLAYVAGSRWVGGNVEFYAKEHPAVFVEWNKERSPWINLHELKQKGAVFVWCITDGETLPDNIQKQFPTLQKPVIIKFDWLRNRRHLPPIEIGIAMLPPANKT